jgi:rRNA maturation endonuclease Nob1
MKENTAKEKRCPYCDVEIMAANFPFCQACGVVFLQCEKCQLSVLDKEAKNCPKCGGPLS